MCLRNKTAFRPGYRNRSIIRCLIEKRRFARETLFINVCRLTRRLLNKLNGTRIFPLEMNSCVCTKIRYDERQPRDKFDAFHRLTEIRINF